MLRATLRKCSSAVRLSAGSPIRASFTRPFTASSGLHGASSAEPDQLSRRSGLRRWTIDDEIVELLRAHPGQLTPPSTSSYDQYQRHAGRVLDHVLPYDAYPSTERRAGTASHDVVRVIHAVKDGQSRSPQHVLSSGFVVEACLPGSGQLDRFVVSCAHTLEQIEHRYPSSAKCSYVLSEGPAGIHELLPVDEIVSSSPRTDIVVGRLHRSATTSALRTLPVSPYPMYRGQQVLLHLYDDTSNADTGRNGQWGRWKHGVVLGYRGHGWEEVEPGTSSALPYILVSTLPSSGSSGGPIVDAVSGAVVGMISGRRMDNRVEKERGWGSSAESVFELFSLPGFVPASKRKRVQQS